MPVTWTVKQGSPDHSYFESLVAALGSGDNLVGASTEQLTFASGDHTVVMKGQFGLDVGGEPESGFLQSMKVYDGGELIAKAKGYQLDIREIGDAFDNGPYAVIFGVLLDRPLVINGSDDGDKFLFAGTGSGRIHGNRGKDEIFGNLGGYKLNGGRGNDTLAMSSEGRDELIGGAGRDTFVPHVVDSSPNLSRIKDFEVGVDRIGLNANDFVEIGSKLNRREFRTGREAKDDDDHVIYDRGKLYYDTDAEGGATQVLLARIKGDPKLTAGDFVVGDFMFL